MSAITELMFWMSFNDHKNTDFDIQVVQRPNIPAPVRRVKYIEISGMDGTLTETDGTYEDIRFEVKLNYLSKTDRLFTEQARVVKNWLNGKGILKFSDDTDVFYKVKDASVDTQIERILWKAGNFSAFFVCDPFTYFESGKDFRGIEGAQIMNPYRMSLPTYRITGEGNCTLNVNGNTATVNITSDLFINIEKQIMYRGDMTSQNNITRLDYPKFVLNPGSNSISVSSGFAVQVKPNWRSL